MALFKSQIVTQASGSIGGVTFTRTRSGMVMRGRAMPVNPNTPAQQQMRGIQSLLSQAWSYELTDLQRQAWSTYASEVSRRNKLGDTIYLTGQQMYIRCNAPRLQGLLSRIDDGPSTFTLGEPVLGVGGQVVEVGPNNQVELSWTPAPENTGMALLWVSAPMSPTRNFFKGPYRFNISRPVTQASGPAANSKLITPIPEGARVWVRVRVSYPDGRLSDAVDGSFVAAHPVPAPEEPEE